MSWTNQGLAALGKAGIDAGILTGDQGHLGETFSTRRDAERVIRNLDHRPSTPELKQISEQFNRSIVNARFDSKAALFAGIDSIGIRLTAREQAAVAGATYTGWGWTVENFSRMASIPSTSRSLRNTIIYVACTLTLFNVGFAMVLAITTFYMPERTAEFSGCCRGFRRRCCMCCCGNGLPGTLASSACFLAPFGISSRNWLLNSGVNAWIFVVLINGFVGASPWGC